MSQGTREHWSIGEVLHLLQDEFPEVTISKIRFLEGQGLIDPERTPSGYRRFYPEDFDRLRWVLIQQRDHYLPLRVIRERLDSGEVVFEPGGPFPDTGPQQRTLTFDEERADEMSEAVASDSNAQAANASSNGTVAISVPNDAPVAPTETKSAAPPKLSSVKVSADSAPKAVSVPDKTKSAAAAQALVSALENEVASVSRPAEYPVARANAADASLTREELVKESGCTNALVSDLERHGLVAGKSVGNEILYDGDALELARIAQKFALHGLDPRHLRSFRLAAEREVGLFAQIVGPQFHRKAPEARQESLDALHELGDLAGSMRSILLGQMLRDQFPGA